MFSIKHESYLQLEASSKSLKAVGAPTCTPLARPPPNCGVKGFDNSPLPKPGHDCPRPEDISMYLALEPFPTVRGLAQSVAPPTRLLPVYPASHCSRVPRPAV